MIAGGVGLAVFGIAGQVLRAIRAHEFALGHDFSENAVEHALTKGAVNALIGYLGLIAPLVLMIGMIMVLLAATRVGLLTRWLRSLGIGAAVVLLPFFTAIFYLQLIPAAWLVSMGSCSWAACPAAIRPRGPPASRGRGPRRPRSAPPSRPAAYPPRPLPRRAAMSRPPRPPGRQRLLAQEAQARLAPLSKRGSAAEQARLRPLSKRG